MESTGQTPWASWALMKDNVSPVKNISEQVLSDYRTSIIETSECEKISMHNRLLVKKTPMIYNQQLNANVVDTSEAANDIIVKQDKDKPHIYHVIS